MLITFEGIEACGKTTQIQKLVQTLRGSHLDVLSLRSPGGTPVSEKIRTLFKEGDATMTPEAELLLVCASHTQLVQQVIVPCLNNKAIVIVDRYLDSTFAYQGYGHQLPFSTVYGLVNFVIGQIRPDMTIYLRIPLELSEERKAKRVAATPRHLLRPDRMESMSKEFFQRVITGYDRLAEEEPGRIRTIDGSLDATVVQELIWQQVGPLVRPLENPTI